MTNLNHVLVACPTGFTEYNDLAETQIIVTAAQPVEFAIDSGDLFDRWTGNPTIARVELIDDDAPVMRVVGFDVLDATYEDASDTGYDLVFAVRCEVPRAGCM
ncbi:MAG: hypothetical protein QM753_11890 [Thermomicrobiales bacterium]